MKKILTVSLFAMMAVSAANADIASTKYVNDIADTKENVANRLTTIPADEVGQAALTDAKYPSAKAVISYVDDALGTMDAGFGTQLDAKLDIDQKAANANKAVITNASGKITTGEIASGMIADKTIVNADISDTAEIAQSKISGLTAALSGKQATIADLTTIRSGAAAGATALQKADIETGTNNGTIKVDGADVAVKGLGSAAYTESSAYAAVAQGSANANKAVITDASGNIKTGTITSGMITDKTIVNADISDTAEIAQSKISGLTAALSGKQATIADLTTIRSGAAAGATALQKADIDTGANNGEIKVGDKNVAVKGLGTAAYTASSAYATSAQGIKADNAVAKTDIGVGANFTIPDECKAEKAVCSLVVREGVAGWEKVTY